MFDENKEEIAEEMDEDFIDDLLDDVINSNKENILNSKRRKRNILEPKHLPPLN